VSYRNRIGRGCGLIVSVMAETGAGGQVGSCNLCNALEFHRRWTLA
jgi:hypothetical protein